MRLALLLLSLVLTGVSVYCLALTNRCACRTPGDCNNPISLYWLAAIIASVLALLAACLAVHVPMGSLLWLLMMAACLSGAQLAGMHSVRKACKAAKSANDLLIDG